MTSCIPIPYYGTAPSGGVGPVACMVAQRVDKLTELLENSLTFGWKKDFMAELFRVVEENQSPNWDGYGARAVSWDAYVKASQFIQALPSGASEASADAEPDGNIVIEWYRSPRKTLSVSISSDGELNYAALIGASRVYGTESFYGPIPSVVLDLISRVAA